MKNEVSWQTLALGMWQSSCQRNQQLIELISYLKLSNAADLTELVWNHMTDRQAVYKWGVSLFKGGASKTPPLGVHVEIPSK